METPPPDKTVIRPSSPPKGEFTKQYFKHSSSRRLNSDAVLAAALKKQYPNLKLSIVPAYSAELLAYAANGFASFTELEDDIEGLPSSLTEKIYIAPSKRIDGGPGIVGDSISFAKFLYKYKDDEFIVYLAKSQDGTYDISNKYFVLSTDEIKVHTLVREAGLWASQLHDEIWVFDGGWWSKDPGLYASVMRASWENVILDPDMKQALIDDHLSFFRSQSTYQSLKVPWKRGIIYYGPPGNGKTISIKAMMHSLYDQKPEVPTLYVRSLKSFFGPEDSIKTIFAKARQFAPCYLVFEDLDSLVSDEVRSYFLNEVDGLQSNDGIFMIGSTNHLERLDPGISKRPSRFDRKYEFPNPNINERIAYCHFWQTKLCDSDNVEFPDKLCDAIAKITNDFSFAYMQEAFVAALLAIARNGGSEDSKSDTGVATVDLADDWVGVVDKSIDDDVDLEKLVLWVEIRKQIAILREGLESGSGE